LLEWLAGSNANADRLCFIDLGFIDLAVVRGLRLGPETAGSGARAPANRSPADTCSSR
jgi:hypothetical protein